VGVKAKRSFVPAYYQIADDLSIEIEAGSLRPGDLIPSESQLCERYGISRMTVRQGLNLLSDAGYIHSVPGKGSYVTAPRLDHLTLEIQEGALRDGRELDLRLVGLEVVTAQAEVASRLGLADGSMVVEFSRTGHLEASPVVFERKYLPYSRQRPLVEQELQYAAFPAVVARASEMHLVKVRVDLYAARTPAEVCSQLGLDTDRVESCLVLEQTVLSQDDRVLGWGKTYCLDGYRLSAESDPFWKRF
jgi:GntR family transcriptional regulator